MTTFKKALKWTGISIGGVALLLGGLTITSIVFPRFTTGLFFGVNTAPVELVVKDSFEPREADAKTTAIVAAAEAFLASLDSTQRSAATFEFSDNEQRSKWSNFPEGMIPRGGLRLGTLNDKQRLYWIRFYRK